MAGNRSDARTEIGDAQWHEIHNTVMDVMVEHGPDGHTDGSDRILNAVLDALGIKGPRFLSEFSGYKEIGAGTTTEDNQ